jgi:bifunctional non-homologous end joining protein LigD
MRAGERLFLPFTSPDWIYELKFDGFRCMAGIDATSHEPLAQQMRNPGSRVRLLTKAGNECTSWYPEIVRDLDLLPDGPHVIDGEACVLREDGTSDFNQLQSRARRSRRVPGAPPVTLCCFDLLVCNGKPTMHLPLTRRKELLRELIALIDDPKPALLFVQDLPADANLFQSMTLPKDAGGLGLEIEGVVAKRRDSPYRPGVRSDDWRKIKRPGWNEGRLWRS